MPQHPQNAAQRPPSSASVFIIISAKAISSVGFGLSLLAIWFQWALPKGVLSASQPQITAVAIHPRKSHRRTRSTGSKPKSPKSTSPNSRRLSAPVPLPPPGASIFSSQDSASRPSPDRHVSFVDSNPTRRSSAPAESKAPDDLSAPLPPSNSQLFSNIITTSPISSTSPLPHHNPLPTPPSEDEILSLGSDSSRPSTATSQNGRSSTPVFRKLRLGLQSMRKRSQTPELPPTPELDNNIPLDPPCPSIKRSNTFIPPWGSSKKAAPSDPLANLETASTRSSCSSMCRSTSSKASSVPSPSTSSFTLLPKKPSKPQRRTSTPIPRTSPYEAPYFATPPLLLDDTYSAYLRRQPRFEDDMRPAASSDSTGSTRGRGSNPQELEGELPRSNGQRRPVPKRRSASEDWSPRLGLSAA